MSIVQMAHSSHRHGLRRHQRGDRGWIALIKIWWRRMQDRRTLATMSDQSLRDIGISRYEAYYEASKPFWRA
ncbi:MAG TPA: DUF1127 domain-containing protein [Xanthobacteraceae bacterium]|nr:DUF1127 domain-containing protein [Xanthobacteraceae bacterium]